jgi:hypothetical protein
MQLTLNENEIRAIERIVKQYYNDESVHYWESNEPDEHIWNDLYIMNTALGFITGVDNDDT